jgi:hypothetical protein
MQSYARGVSRAPNKSASFSCPASRATSAALLRDKGECLSVKENQGCKSMVGTPLAYTRKVFRSS